MIEDFSAERTTPSRRDVMHLALHDGRLAHVMRSSPGQG